VESKAAIIVLRLDHQMPHDPFYTGHSSFRIS